MVTLNTIGVIAYLLFASRCWIEPELANMPGASGGAPIIWGLTALPILITFFTIDFLWVLFAYLAYLKKKKWTLHPSFLFIPAVWAIAIYVDFSHHGI